MTYYTIVTEIKDYLYGVFLHFTEGKREGLH